MPELPEVETIVRQLCARGIEGRQIVSVKIRWPRLVEPLSPAVFRRRLRGEGIERISRVGKWMLFSLSSGETLMIHLRMSGSFSFSPGRFDRAVLELSGGTKLYFRDTRKFGRWKLVDDPQAILGKLGPDALTAGFTRRYFQTAVQRRRRMIKPLLLDQTLVAGLGNIYADEALWEARIHPERQADSLTVEEIGALFQAIRHVLRIGVKNRGTSLGDGKTNYRDLEGKSGGHRDKVKAYGRAGEPCERCGTPMVKKTVFQRGSTFCPDCQGV
jgi:formamidopyrimidine-DNA glycosylase